MSLCKNIVAVLAHLGQTPSLLWSGNLNYAGFLGFIPVPITGRLIACLFTFLLFGRLQWLWQASWGTDKHAKISFTGMWRETGERMASKRGAEAKVQ